MSTKLVLGVVVFFIVMFSAVIGVGAMSYIDAHNYSVEQEAGLAASWDDSQNVLTQYSLKVSEAIQVPAKYKDGYRELIEADMQGRYGEGGSKASWQWLKERNLDFDSTMYTKVQNMIEAGRNKFENSQREVIQKRKGYQTNINYLWRGFWIRMAGYPKVDLSKYDVISSTHAKKTFETGIDEGLKF
jgi:hypothetical protein